MIRDKYGRYVDERIPEIRVTADSEKEAVNKLRELAKYFKRRRV